MEHEKLIEKHLGINTPYWIKEKLNNAINEALSQPPVISSFCHHNGTYTTITDSNGNEVCCKCRKPLAK